MKSAPLHPNEAQRIAALENLGLLDTMSEAEFDELTLLASVICQTPIALVSLVDRDRQWFKSKIGLDASETPRDVAFCAHAILQNGVFQVPDATKDARFADNPLVVSGPQVRFYAGVPLLPVDGMPIGTLCVIDHEARTLSPEQDKCLRSIANQVERLIRLRQQNKEILKTNARLGFFRTTLEHMTEGVVLQNAKAEIIEHNAAATAVLGLSSEELLGKTSLDPSWKALREDGTPFPGEDHPAVVTLRTGKPLRNIPMRLQLPTGQTRWIEINSAPIFEGTNPKPNQVVCTFEDVTEKRESHRMAIQNAKMVSLGELASGVAHEINNPLAVIIARIYGIRQEIERGVFKAERFGPEIERIERMSTRIAKIVKGLSVFSKSGEYEAKSDVDLGHLVSDSLDLLHERLEGLGVAVRVDLPPPGTKIRCRPFGIAQVLLNLLMNAKFAVRELSEKWIEISVKLEGNRAVFSVTDSGSGIPAEAADRIFEPFYTTKPVGVGTGLGLSISRGIIDAHGGTIRVVPDLPHTRFEFEIPIA
jgi:PAS domain S-box-containing protein